MPSANLPPNPYPSLEGTDSSPVFLLFTAAYNAEGTISKLIESVVSQSWLPIKWIIVDDGSTDSTADVVEKYQNRHACIELKVREKKKEHSFGAKARALNVVISEIKLSEFEFIGILDADVELPDDYFKTLLTRMIKEDRLGIAGGGVHQFYDGCSHQPHRRHYSDSVAGAVQMFNMACFLQIGGRFLVLPSGGIDAAMEIMARANGWVTKTFWDLEVTHFGRVGSAAGSKFKFRFKRGIIAFCFGYNVLFLLTRLVYRLPDSPFILGSVVEFAGFIYARFRYKTSFLPKAVVAALRQEQRGKLFRLFTFT